MARTKVHRNRLVKKQALKYFLAILTGLVTVSVAKWLWSLELAFHIGMAIGGTAVLLVFVIFDALSIKDLIPIFKR